MAETDYTARVRDELLAEHDESPPVAGREQQLREARAKYPNAHVYYDAELGDVVVDISTGRGA